VAGALAAVELDGEAATNPYDLGAARRKLLTVASVLAMGTPVLVLDEPTAGLDGHGAVLIRDLVAAAQGSGRTVIAVSHDLRFVAEVFRRVVVLRSGTILLDGAPADVFGAENGEALRSTGLEPPEAAAIAHRLGMRGIATDAALVAALAEGG
jgi:energy-coupling factor transport system ATP-binding protein